MLGGTYAEFILIKRYIEIHHAMIVVLVCTGYLFIYTYVYVEHVGVNCVHE